MRPKCRVLPTNNTTECGGALVELAIIFSVLVAASFGGFMVVLPRLGNPIKDRITAGFDQEAASPHFLQQLSLEGVLTNKDGCGMLAQLSSISHRMELRSGVDGFCATVLEVSLDDAGTVQGNGIFTSSDASGVPCADEASIPANFKDSVAAGLSTDGQRTQLALGTYIKAASTGLTEDLFAKQKISADSASGGPGSAATSCPCPSWVTSCSTVPPLF